MDRETLLRIMKVAATARGGASDVLKVLRAALPAETLAAFHNLTLADLVKLITIGDVLVALSDE